MLRGNFISFYANPQASQGLRRKTPYPSPQYMYSVCQSILVHTHIHTRHYGSNAFRNLLNFQISSFKMTISNPTRAQLHTAGSPPPPTHRHTPPSKWRQKRVFLFFTDLNAAENQVHPVWISSTSRVQYSRQKASKFSFIVSWYRKCHSLNAIFSKQYPSKNFEIRIWPVHSPQKVWFLT